MRSIKSRLGGSKRYKKGFYIIQNPEKYIGNPQEVIYQSSWEFAFCKFCDLNDRVIKWCGEGLQIAYQITNDIGTIETHRYYPDFYLEMNTPGDKEKYEKFLIEIKPKKDCEFPVQPKTQTLKMLENYEYALRTHKKNLYKWAFTKQWCEKRGIKFIIVTELDLKKKGLIP
jgi:hypothetical protein